LLHLIREEKRFLVQARLQAMYLYKSGQEQDYAAIGKQVGYERHTVGKWFSLYDQQGLASSNPELNPVERFWRDMKDKAAFLNFKDEQELEDWITATTKNYSHEQIASLTGYQYIKNAMQQLIFDMESS